MGACGVEVRNLQSKGWLPVVETDFLKTEDLEYVRTTARRRLIDELPSEGARYTAYRLILKPAAVAAGVKLDDSGIDFLS